MAIKLSRHYEVVHKSMSLQGCLISGFVVIDKQVSTVII